MSNTQAASILLNIAQLVEQDKQNGFIPKEKVNGDEDGDGDGDGDMMIKILHRAEDKKPP